MNIKHLISCLLLALTILSFNACTLTGKNEMAAYLMVYFSDSDHDLHMAISTDGYSFTSLNKGKSIIAGDTIAMQKGIRDPHIFRAPNGTFYLAMTDLHIFAQREGLRETEWERDGKEYGWGNNKGLVLMKSDDLIHWDLTNLDVHKVFSEIGDIGCAWAPEITYDEDKVMVYFTMRIKNGLCKIYYAYMNDDFTAMETTPELLFKYPKDVAYIDADITKAGEQFHMFYTPHDGMPGIKQAVSNKINKGYIYQEAWIDPEKEACEAPNVWKRIGEEKWVLMYDIYGIHPHNFGFMETSDFKTFTNLGHFNKGVMKATNFSSPKHGAVIHLTKNEAIKLAKHYNYDIQF